MDKNGDTVLLIDIISIVSFVTINVAIDVDNEELMKS